MRNWTTLLCLAAFSALYWSWSDAADKDRDSNNKSQSSSRNDNDRPFLGITIEELHPGFASHLQGMSSTGQGLMVEAVSPDSPAAKAGIKSHDILLTYDDQKLFSAEQLVKLIHSDRPGREVKLGVIQGGKQMNFQAQLGERPARWNYPRSGEEMAGPRGPGRWHPEMWGGPSGDQGRFADSGWSEFDSMSLKKSGKDRFEATIAYTDRDGKLKKHQYEGTREEIRKRIEDDKDLRPVERDHLVRSLDLEDRGMPMFFPPEEGWYQY